MYRSDRCRGIEDQTDRVIDQTDIEGYNQIDIEDYRADRLKGYRAHRGFK